MNPALAPITPESNEDRLKAAKQLLSHTPTPWQYEEPESGDSSVGIQSSGPAISAEVAGAPDVVPICELLEPAYLDRSVPHHEWWPEGAYKPIGNACANGKFIVLACNNHFELLLTLKNAIAVLEDVEPRHVDLPAMRALVHRIEASHA